MGIKLDWEIENERERVPGKGEDPEFVRQRRRARLRAFAVLFVFLLIVGGVIGGIALRLRMVNDEIERALRATVAAEVTALRIGNEDDFINAQRSATDEWIDQQRLLFREYQTLKATTDVNLTGRIIDLTIDGYRARVMVEEIIAGVPYARVWFYWRYGEDGWRHTVPDYVFWGESSTLSDERVAVNYNALDQATAEAVYAELSRWMTFACAAMPCESPLNVSIIADSALTLGWSQAEPWTLHMPSPLVTAMRLDRPFEPNAREQIANLVAERLVSETLIEEPLYPNDAYYFRQAAISWLVGQFLGRETNSFLMASFAQAYGADAVGRVLAAMQLTSDVRIFAQVAGVPDISALTVDWRDYLTWRLRLEDDFNLARDFTNFFALYDSTSDPVRVLAQSRFDAAAATGLTVVSVAQGLDAGSTPILTTLARNEAQADSEITFRLVDGLWRRAN